MKGNEERRVLVEKVICYERISDAIHDMHVSLAHSLYAKTHKIMSDKTWYGLPDTAIKVYIKLCPECLMPATALLTDTKKPLKMIMSETIRSRAHKDLIDYRWTEWKGHKWIL